MAFVVATFGASTAMADSNKKADCCQQTTETVKQKADAAKKKAECTKQKAECCKQKAQAKKKKAECCKQKSDSLRHCTEMKVNAKKSKINHAVDSAKAVQKKVKALKK